MELQALFRTERKNWGNQRVKLSMLSPRVWLCLGHLSHNTQSSVSSTTEDKNDILHLLLLKPVVYHIPYAGCMVWVVLLILTSLQGKF